MSQALGDLLSKRNYDEPPEVRMIKDFVQRAIGVTPRVSITPETYLIQVPSAGAAGALRPKLRSLERQLETKKRLTIRIS